jgi:hypothetical protein
VVLLSNMSYRRRERKDAYVDTAAKKDKLPRCILRSSERRRIEGECDCGHRLCMNGTDDGSDPAVLATRAKFSESFCREQARLVARHGLPSWTKRELRPRNKQRLQKFWDEQAELVARSRSRT